MSSHYCTMLCLFVTRVSLSFFIIVFLSTRRQHTRCLPVTSPLIFIPPPSSTPSQNLKMKLVTHHLLYTGYSDLCLLGAPDAVDDLTSADLGGRRLRGNNNITKTPDLIRRNVNYLCIPNTYAASSCLNDTYCAQPRVMCHS